jgi:hypothetical protein
VCNVSLEVGVERWKYILGGAGAVVGHCISLVKN